MEHRRLRIFHGRMRRRRYNDSRQQRKLTHWRADSSCRPFAIASKRKTGVGMSVDTTSSHVTLQQSSPLPGDPGTWGRSAGGPWYLGPLGWGTL
eukprot:1177700-Prorocentrum_minimum.AAC.3